MTPEQIFITNQLAQTLNTFARTGFMKVRQTQPGTHDYACMTFRDCDRLLIARVLGDSDKDIIQGLNGLLYDDDATIKIGFVPDNMRARIALEDLRSSYCESEQTHRQLRGLRIIYLPSDFDADHETQRNWMENYVAESISSKIIQNIFFGGLSTFEYDTFANYRSGRVGLKYVILDEVNHNGCTHMPTFKKQIGCQTDARIRNILEMLVGTGLIKCLPHCACYAPSIKGRMLLDLTKRLLLEVFTRSSWSEELLLVLRLVGYENPPFFDIDHDQDYFRGHAFLSTLDEATMCPSNCGRDLLEDISPDQLGFYGKYPWQKYYEEVKIVPGVSPSWFTDEEALMFIDDEA